MFHLAKTSQDSSSVGTKVSKGVKGRVEAFWETNPDGTVSFHFQEYGNYGKLRYWYKSRPLDREYVAEVLDPFQALVGGEVETTRIAVDNPSFDVDEDDPATEVATLAQV